MAEKVPLGAYGLTFGNLDAGGLLNAAPRDWPSVTVHFRPGTSGQEVIDVRAGRIAAPHRDFRLMEFDRDTASATFVAPARDDDAIVHPGLGLTGAAFAAWHGRQSLHSGAFVLGDGAWAFPGGSDTGKSSLAAALHHRGVPVLSDDTLVLEDGYCLAGVRCVDLRLEAAAALQVDGRPARADRLRLHLPPVPHTVPLRGFVFLRWGERVAVRELALAERIERLMEVTSILRRLNTPVALLDLAVLPAYELVRPRDWGALAETLDLVLDLPASLASQAH